MIDMTLWQDVLTHLNIEHNAALIDQSIPDAVEEIRPLFFETSAWYSRSVPACSAVQPISL